MKQRNLHQQVRVVYRACRRIYGKEKTQDECLRVFKVVFPELNRLKSSENEREVLNESIRPALQEIAKSWHPQKQLKALIERVENLIGLPFDEDREELISLLEDITPVAMRIRKLTTWETGRLMGISERELEIMHSCGLSKSSLYKLHGNSIVVDVLYHIFRKLLVETEPEHKPGEQLTLF
jgi:site-specific DNA-cytosine methylase